MAGVDADDDGFAGWVILKLMGHRRLGGKVREATIAGAPIVRIDIPHPQELEVMASTQFYSPTAIYAITPTTEEIARAIAMGAPEPVSRWDLRVIDSGGAGIEGDEPF
jgi:hypothetical protein